MAFVLHKQYSQHTCNVCYKIRQLVDTYLMCIQLYVYFL